MYSTIEPGLAFTGIAVGWQLAAAATAITAGLAIMRVLPRRRRRRG